MDLILFTIPVVRLLFIAWIVFILDSIVGKWLTQAFALHPRSLFGLVGIFTSPFLHGFPGHIAANSGGFLVLGCLIAIQGWNMFVFVSIALTLMVGVILWLFSPNSVIGASGVIFGYLGYLLMYGITVDGGLSLLAGAIGLVAYGHIWIGIFPRDPMVSWLAHAAGFVCGLMLGHYLGLRAIEIGLTG